MPNWKKIIVSGSDAILKSLNVSGAVTASTFSGSHIGPLTGTASWATSAGNTSTIDVNVFGSDVSSYILFSNVAGTTGVAIGGDADFRYNASTNTLTATNISATSLTGSLQGTSSWSTNAISASNTPNAIITASVSSNTLTFTKGNGTTFNLTVNTGSGGGGTGNPGGSPTQIQYNSASVFNGVPTLIYNGTTLSGTGSFSGSFTGNLTGTASWSTNAIITSQSNILRYNTGIGADPYMHLVFVTTSGSSNGSVTTQSLFVNSGVKVFPGFGGVINVGGLEANSIKTIDGLSTTTFTFNPARYVFNSNGTLSIGCNTTTTGSFLAGGGITGSLQGTASIASNVTTLNQNVLISSGSTLTIGSNSAGISENTLTLGARDGSQEGGQIGFLPAGTYVSTSYFDLYTNRLRILKGNMAQSTAEVASWNMHTLQMQLAGYNSVTAFTGAPIVGVLAFDSNGNILTAPTGSGSIGSGLQLTNNTNDYIVTATGAYPSALNGESNLQFNGSTLTVTGNVTANSFTGSLFGTCSYALNGGGGGGGTPGGTNTQIQYNSGSTFAGASGLVYIDSTSTTSAEYLQVNQILTVSRKLLLTGFTPINSNYTITGADSILLADTTGGTLDIDLTGDQVNGRILIIKDAGGAAQSQNITFTGTIDGGAFVMDKNLQTLTLLYEQGSGSWLIIANYAP